MKSLRRGLEWAGEAKGERLVALGGGRAGWVLGAAAGVSRRPTDSRGLGWLLRRPKNSWSLQTQDSIAVGSTDCEAQMPRPSKPACSASSKWCAAFEDFGEDGREVGSAR